MQAPKAAPRTTAKTRGPFVHEDEDADELPAPALDTDLPIASDLPVLSPRRSQPLQEMSPNASPRRQLPDQKQEPLETSDADQPTKEKVKPSTTPPNEDLHSTTPAPATEPPMRTETDHAAHLASLISNRRGHTSPAEPVQRIKSRKLGRAPSGSNLMSRSLSGSTGAAAAEDGDDGDERTSSGLQQPELPSTQLGYEAPEAEQARLQMAKKMGTSFPDDTVGKRVEKVGMVKDAVSGGGGGARAARSRPKK